MHSERQTQNFIINAFTSQLGYSLTPPCPSPVNAPLLSQWLSRQDYTPEQITHAINTLTSLTRNQSSSLSQVNASVYNLLRYGLQGVPDGKGSFPTVHFIDWQHPERNTFTISQEVTVMCFDGKTPKRLDLVLSVNGIALAVIELKDAAVSVEKGVGQLITYQRRELIAPFFSTVQLLIAGNESQGVRYGVIDAPAKFFLSWTEEPQAQDSTSRRVRTLQAKTDNLLLKGLISLCLPERLLMLTHDFMIFENETKKTARHNQFFAVMAARERVIRREGGIIWNTQGSGKSLIMVWLAKWIVEHQGRVVIITDREELDSQIQTLFGSVKIDIARADSSENLRTLLASSQHPVICTLIHKYGHGSDIEDYSRELLHGLPRDFHAKGNITAFIDECHRSNSGVLHEAVRKLMPDAVLIGFTGTPLLRTDKRTSAEVFGTFIHTYKFNDAVKDGVILSLRYEARNVEQALSDREAIDAEFERVTCELTDKAKNALKARWATFSKLYSSRERLERIAADIMKDMNTLSGLADGTGNAILAAGSVYEACRYWEIFTSHGFTKCAVITSYDPSGKNARSATSDLRRESEEDCKKHVYDAMLCGKSQRDFETDATTKFKTSPADMKLLIVVDKLLTGFDAPSARYLYIDKSMRDHGLFQAVCRVNRPCKGKTHGVIIDYMDLFRSIQSAVNDYTSEAFSGYDREDIEGLITNRYDEAHAKMEQSREKLTCLLENVDLPRRDTDYIAYFCEEEPTRREELYGLVSSITRSFAECCGRLVSHYGYSPEGVKSLREEIHEYCRLKDIVRLSSGDYLGRSYDADMRYILDTYVKAGESEITGVIDEITAAGCDVGVVMGRLPCDEIAKAEIIENNLMHEIRIRMGADPEYYTRLSSELEKLLKRRKTDAIDYADYIREMSELARKILNVSAPIDEVLCRYLNGNSELAERLTDAITRNISPGFRENLIKSRVVRNAIYSCLHDASYSESEAEKLTDEIFSIILHRQEYD